MVRIKKLRVEYQIPYEDLQLVRMETGGITLIQKGVKQARARVIPCPDNSTSQVRGDQRETS